jgi:hypothetical protein
MPVANMVRTQASCRLPPAARLLLRITAAIASAKRLTTASNPPWPTATDVPVPGCPRGVNRSVLVNQGCASAVSAAPFA